MKSNSATRRFSDSSVLSVCFFLSGFASLAYQLIWTRLAYARFGVNAQVLSVVISVFMLGLLLGAILGAPLARWARKRGCSSLATYAMTEIFIGIGAAAVPWLFALGQKVLLSGGAMDSLPYSFFSALTLTLSILPFCTAMGMTYPLVMTHLQETSDPQERETSFSRLYVANVLGGLGGIVITAFFLVELLGFQGCLRIVCVFNLAAAGLCLWLAVRTPQIARRSTPVGRVSRPKDAGIWEFRLLFWTGFTSMGMEVVWTRAFTPILKTQVYSFAALLAVYMVATFVGSILYRRQKARRKLMGFPAILGMLAMTALLPVVINDPRMHDSVFLVLFSIVPFCAVLGYLTPRLVDDVSLGAPDAAGWAYAINLLGCILGPLTAGYLLLPMLGARAALLLLAVPLFAVFAARIFSKKSTPHPDFAWGGATLVLLVMAIFFSRNFEESFRGVTGKRTLRRDFVATVVASGEGLDKYLFVNGIGITRLVSITKYITHLPLLALDHPPKSALIICLGMGTSYRSSLSWGIETTSVELVPSVKELVPFYFPDLAGRVGRPGMNVIIDDGRRFLERTGKTYDVITIDPPPPVEAAGSSLLYSKEFYALARKRLAPGGILQQWYPDNGELVSLNAIARSLVESFPYVLVLPSCDRWGFHFLASDKPIHLPGFEEARRRMPAWAWRDLKEWKGEKATRSDLTRILRQAKNASIMVDANPKIVITDDKPFTEYFLLRRALFHTR